jgi:hypothetical protein
MLGLLMLCGNKLTRLSRVFIDLDQTYSQLVLYSEHHGGVGDPTQRPAWSFCPFQSTTCTSAGSYPGGWVQRPIFRTVTPPARAEAEIDRTMRSSRPSVRPLTGTSTDRGAVAGCGGDGTARVRNCSAIRAHPLCLQRGNVSLRCGHCRQGPSHPKDALPCSCRGAARAAGRQRIKRRIRPAPMPWQGPSSCERR